MSGKPWGNIGTWAADAELAEAEEREAASAAASSAAESSSHIFPSLKESVSTKTKKKKTTLTLSEFYSASSGQRSATEYSQGLTTDEMSRLPTGPKQRSPEEMQYGRLGGGFSSYERSGSLTGRGRERDDADGSWGGGPRRSYGGFDQERRGTPPSRISEFDQPSRADEVDNWALTKKPMPSLDSGRQDRYGSLGGGSRADDTDNWAVGKKPVPSRSSTFGSGFRDSAQEADRWTRGGGAFRESERERPRLVLDPPRGDSGVNEPLVVAKTNKPNPFGAARPREEVLAEKGLNWKKMDSEIEAKKASTPTSTHSSRPSSAQSSRSEGQGLQQRVDNVVKPRPKVNPFGDAKPREVLLEEQGKDWRKIDLDLEHRSVDRLETDEERKLKEEIDHLKKELERESTMEANSESLQGSGGDQSSLCDIILLRERELETLIHDLDSKVRFGQKAVERPGSRPSSGAGRVAGFPERPPSQSSSIEETRNMEFMDRPRSRGAGDVWARPADDRRSFGSGRDRGFIGNRDLDRPRSRDRW
ncbi:hypothetical protein I3843_05G160300 [Carya illinoinensis]|uniref:Eukaryotic translation initiation factor 4B2-like n=2 Tax=Carya illinoinensis TaxID=32201 RepID=A0A8T1QLB5_CARIL|nr:eukaryotic translation initiation factor 4B2-like [Carya illinoinensis]KAG2708093.1 hypothetical protein I3760_05G175700 [Carya illinoinensis]KAG6654924.1 hypothetical protein CIPAW_05G179600 [Carya illinoinensis]KAG6713883.1 hypothetical protein I3842_05G175400 [Carya illinoinensis]KAG7980032.1 hypothetical protein I3843_05G160300 [Carya illinoinensis]